MNRLTIFSLVFMGINLIFIPLLSLYGLRVCPVLSVPGFGFGCYYSAIFIAVSTVLNLLLIYALNSSLTPHKFLSWVRENRVKAFFFAYLSATAVALIALKIFLGIDHLGNRSRAPEILFLASLLLGLTQAYGLAWALPLSAMKSSEKTYYPPNFQRLWRSHTLRTMLPVLIVTIIIIHFLISQSVAFNRGKTAPVVSHDELITHISYVIIFLITWLFITLTFHFLTERDHATGVQSHLGHLERQNFQFRSNLGQSFGLWTAIFHHLNSFSQTLGERTRLLKNFSHFVTAGVAEEALHQELQKNSGTTRELTVIMTDIRNFTTLAEKLSPQEVVTLLNEYFTEMLAAISHFPVNIDKFIGDGILAYVETKQALGTQAENELAVDAGIAMLERLKKINITLSARNLPALKIGIGIYRGPLVIGLIGSEAKLQHTIIGDSVNRAARLESLCKELQVPLLISREIWASLACEKQQLFQSFGARMIKGLSEPIEVFGLHTRMASHPGT